MKNRKINKNKDTDNSNKDKIDYLNKTLNKVIEWRSIFINEFVGKHYSDEIKLQRIKNMIKEIDRHKNEIEAKDLFKEREVQVSPSGANHDYGYKIIHEITLDNVNEIDKKHDYGYKIIHEITWRLRSYIDGNKESYGFGVITTFGDTIYKLAKEIELTKKRIDVKKDLSL